MDYSNLSKESLIKIINELKDKQGLNWKKESESIKPFDLVDQSSKSLKGNTENFLIEGDNLSSLKYLSEKYLEKIKLFIIDPPYNTGHSYMKYKDNRNSSGFRHQEWLNFMAPRIELSYKLGREDSLYAFFIDDFNADYLKLLCDQIFGEKNFLGRIVWECRSGTGISDTFFSVNHEYVLLYSKNSDSFSFFGEDKDLSKFKNPDSDPRGPWRSDTLSAAKPGGDVYYPITNPVTGKQFYPPKGRYWPYNRVKMQRYIDEGRVLFPKNDNGNPSKKTFLKELKTNKKPLSSWWDEYLTSQGTKELKELFDGEKVFDYPKPVELIKKIIDQTCKNNDDIVLDFFAGSGTTAQAVMELNKENGTEIPFILCTNNENEICEKVTYPRIVKVSQKINLEIGLKYLKIVNKEDK